MFFVSQFFGMHIDIHPLVVKMSSLIAFCVSLSQTSCVLKNGKVLRISADYSVWLSVQNKNQLKDLPDSPSLWRNVTPILLFYSVWPKVTLLDEIIAEVMLRKGLLVFGVHGDLLYQKRCPSASRTFWRSAQALSMCVQVYSCRGISRWKIWKHSWQNLINE